MSRRIICEKCGNKLGPQHPEDVAMGWKRRVVTGKAYKPEVHRITTYRTSLYAGSEVLSVEDLPSLVCDDCGDKIPDGSAAVAVTMWRGMEPEQWEDEYFK